MKKDKKKGQRVKKGAELCIESITQYNEFIQQNYEDLVGYIKKKNYKNLQPYWDFDCFQSTYERVYNAIQYRPKDYVQDHKVYFTLSYYSNRLEKKIKDNKMNQMVGLLEYPDDNGNDGFHSGIDIADLVWNDNNSQDRYDYADELLSTIDDWVRQKYPQKEYNIWRIYINTRPMTYIELGDILGIKSSHLSQTIRAINDKVKEVFEYNFIKNDEI